MLLLPTVSWYHFSLSVLQFFASLPLQSVHYPLLLQSWLGFKWNELKVAQLYPTLCDPHGLIQSMEFFRPRILEWVAFPFSRGSSQPRDWTQVSLIAGRFFSSWASWGTREALGRWLGFRLSSDDIWKAGKDLPIHPSIFLFSKHLLSICSVSITELAPGDTAENIDLGCKFTVYPCRVLYGSHQPHVALQHLKCSVNRSVVSDSFATPWTVALQASLSMGFSRQDTEVGCHFLVASLKWDVLYVHKRHQILNT